MLSRLRKKHKQIFLKCYLTRMRIALHKKNLCKAIVAKAVRYMFKKLSHILTAFLFINCSHPVFFILFNVNDVTQKFIFHFADFIFSEHGNFLLCRNPYGPHRPHIRYTPHLHIRESAYFLYPELPHIPLLLQPEYIFPSG